MSDNLAIKTEMLVWARKRAGMEVSALKKQFPKLAKWESGEVQPTLKQLEDFAHAVHIPIGYLFLSKPINEPMPISDFRTLTNSTNAHPSPNLLDTLYLCQQRQDWYRDYARINALPKLDFIKSVTIEEKTVEIAETIRKTLRISLEDRQHTSNSDVLRQFIAKVEDSGILVMISSIVGCNSHRKLDVEEFRGFALVDDIAPIIFINAADSKAAQIFTLAHELAHLWIGESGVFDIQICHPPKQNIERWCNAVAAEILVPIKSVREEYNQTQPLREEVPRLAYLFKVSTLVVLRRLFDAGFVEEGQFRQIYNEEIKKSKDFEKKNGKGGDFYRTLGTRIGKRFARAVLASTLEGQTLFRDAFRLLGIKKTVTFYQTANELKVIK
jgi:Zn-dependent peptidase ImmA (M78 family)